MDPKTVIVAVLSVVLLVNIAVSGMGMASALLPLHGGLGAVAFVASLAYTYIGRNFRPALVLGLLLSVLTGLTGALGLAALLYQAENAVQTLHAFTGSATFLIGLVGGILVGRAARRS